MNHDTFFTDYIKPVVVTLCDKYSVTSVYCCGSFLYPDAWKLGVSDIDLFLLTEQEISVREDIILNISELSNEFVDNMKGESFKIVISYKVWNVKEFSKTDSWMSYLNSGEFIKASIIEDQLFFCSRHKFVYGTDLNDLDQLSINALNYREYLIRQYNNKSIAQYNVSFISEINRVIRSCRIYYFLWTNKYIYHTNKLIQEAKDEFDELTLDALRTAYEKKEYIGSDPKLISMENELYFSETKKMYVLRKEVVKRLVNREKSKNTNYVNGNFVDFS